MEKHFESELTPPIPEDYFLIINANRWIKNSRRGILAVQKFFKKHPDSKTKVIVLGAKPLPNMLKLDERFIVKGYVSRHDLECHLKFAKALIYPTLNEGFGYPPLEAMKYETPVIASDICSVPEVCGSAAIYVNPFSVESIAEGIERLGSHESMGLKQYTKIKKLQDEMLLWLCNDILSQHKP
nr:glycosyltransferase [Alteromonas sp. Cnat3-28]